MALVRAAAAALWLLMLAGAGLVGWAYVTGDGDGVATAADDCESRAQVFRAQGLDIWCEGATMRGAPGDAAKAQAAIDAIRQQNAPVRTTAANTGVVSSQRHSEPATAECLHADYYRSQGIKFRCTDGVAEPNNVRNYDGDGNLISVGYRNRYPTPTPVPFAQRSAAYRHEYRRLENHQGGPRNMRQACASYPEEFQHYHRGHPEFIAWHQAYTAATNQSEHARTMGLTMTEAVYNYGIPTNVRERVAAGDWNEYYVVLTPELLAADAALKASGWREVMDEYTRRNHDCVRAQTDWGDAQPNERPRGETDWRYSEQKDGGVTSSETPIGDGPYSE